jgi:hypothetical protein
MILIGGKMKKRWQEKTEARFCSLAVIVTESWDEEEKIVVYSIVIQIFSFFRTTITNVHSGKKYTGAGFDAETSRWAAIKKLPARARI